MIPYHQKFLLCWIKINILLWAINLKFVYSFPPKYAPIFHQTLLLQIVAATTNCLYCKSMFLTINGDVATFLKKSLSDPLNRNLSCPSLDTRVRRVVGFLGVSYHKISDFSDDRSERDRFGPINCALKASSSRFISVSNTVAAYETGSLASPPLIEVLRRWAITTSSSFPSGSFLPKVLRLLHPSMLF